MRKTFALLIVLTFFAASCRIQKSLPPKNLKRTVPFARQNKTCIFRARFTFFSNEFSGNLLVKKQEDNSHRLVFLNEIGMKFFDFTVSADTFKVTHIFSPMNRKQVLSLLKNDFRFLLMKFKEEGAFFEQKKKKYFFWRPHKTKIYYKLNESSGLPESASAPSVSRRKIEIQFLDYVETIPRKINLRHHFPVKVCLEMELLQKP